jgi:hypothetical protein
MRMTLASYYTFTWWAVLLLAFLLTGISGAMPVSLSVLGFFACGWVVAPRFLGGHRILKVTWPMLLLFLVIFWTRGAFALMKEGKIIHLVVSFFAGLLPFFLSRGQKIFGVWIAFMTVSLIAVVSVILWNGLTEYLLFVIFLIFLLLNLNAANLVDTSGVTASQFLPLPEKHFRQFVPSLIWGFAVALCVFLFFPRKPALHNPFGVREMGQNIGYTGAVSLQMQSQLKPTATLAMTIESSDSEWLEKEGPGIYFRGNVLDKFDGKDWWLSDPGTQEYHPGIDLRFTTHYSLRTKNLKIYREAHAARGVVYPGVLAQIRAPLNLLGGLSFDQNGNLTRGHSETIRYSYEVLTAEPLKSSRLADLSVKEITRQLGQPTLLHPLALMPAHDELTPYLQLPDSLKESRIFGEWVREVDADLDDMTVLQVIDGLKAHYAQKFTPSLDHKFDSRNALEAFLKQRVGHCEFFATAAVLYLRALGIPTRLALGYRGGTYNPVSKALQVYDHNAHAWAEFYFPVVGWVAFDPTPALPAEEMSRLQALMTVYVGAAKFWANRYLVDYNDITQRQLVKTLATAKTYGLSSWKTPDLAKPSNGFLVGITVTVLFFLRRFIRRRKRLRALRRLPLYYLEFEKRLQSLGFQRKEGETFLQFHSRIGQESIDAELLKKMDQSLEQDLYSPSPLREEDRKSLLVFLRRHARS